MAPVLGLSGGPGYSATADYFLVVSEDSFALLQSSRHSK